MERKSSKENSVVFLVEGEKFKLRICLWGVGLPRTPSEQRLRHSIYSGPDVLAVRLSEEAIFSFIFSFFFSFFFGNNFTKMNKFKQLKKKENGAPLLALPKSTY